MTYKRHWDDSVEGISHIYSYDSSACHTMQVDGLKLSIGKTYKSETGEEEYALIILGGTCDVTGDGFSYLSAGVRKNVFDGKCTAIYLPRRKSFKVAALTDLRMIIARCPSDTDYEPAIVKPEDVVVKKLGKPGFEREAHFILDERVNASRIYLGENFICGGQWSSFPGHRHDRNNYPNEVFSEEIYYFEYDKAGGYGIQQVYTDDCMIDEAYPVRQGDIVEIPRGYHPCTVAPGYTGYLLWLMSCDKRGFCFSTDPEQAWQIK